MYPHFLSLAFPPLCLLHFSLPQNISPSHSASVSSEFLISLGGHSPWVLTGNLWKETAPSGPEVFLTIPVKPCWLPLQPMQAWASHPWEENSGELKTWRVPLETPFPTDFTHSADPRTSVNLRLEDESHPQRAAFASCFHWHQGYCPVSGIVSGRENHRKEENCGRKLQPTV